MTSVATIDQNQLENKPGFVKKESTDCNYPIYLEAALERYWENTKIDVAGWASFKRLVLLEA